MRHAWRELRIEIFSGAWGSGVLLLGMHPRTNSRTFSQSPVNSRGLCQYKSGSSVLFGSRGSRQKKGTRDEKSAISTCGKQRIKVQPCNPKMGKC